MSDRVVPGLGPVALLGEKKHATGRTIQTMDGIDRLPELIAHDLAQRNFLGAGITAVVHQQPRRFVHGQDSVILPEDFDQGVYVTSVGFHLCEFSTTA